MKTRAILTFAAVLGAAACATATPYAPAGGDNRYGYSDQKLEEDRYRVTFSGNSLTDLRTVETYLLFRAAELTTEIGDDWFTIVRQQQDADRELRGTGSSAGFSGRFFHPNRGFFGYNDPFFNDVNIREITRYEVTAEILTGDDPEPNDADAYDASEVIENLGPTVVRPEGETA